MSLVDGGGKALRLDNELGRGGQAEVWALKNSRKLVFKRYHASTLQKDPSLELRIESMVGSPPRGVKEQRTGHRLLAWPVDVVRESGRFAGFLMPVIDVASSVELHEVSNPSSRADATGPTGWVQGFTWRYLVATAANLSLATDVLHRAGVVIGDFNARNIRVWSTARVTFLDCDSMQVAAADGTHFLCRVGFLDFTAPELPSRTWKTVVRAPSSDLFALAIHVHQLLLQGEHPFRGVWHRQGDKPRENVLAREAVWAHGGDRRLSPRPTAIPLDILPKTTIELFRRAFVEGATNPNRRPTAREWHNELTALQASLVRCSADPAHEYRSGLRRCPWCAHAGAPPSTQTALRPPRQPRRVHAVAASPKRQAARALSSSWPSSLPSSWPFPAPAPAVSAGPARALAQAPARSATRSAAHSLAPRAIALSPRPVAARSALSWFDRRFWKALGTSFTVILALSAVESLAGFVFAAKTLQTKAGSVPYLRGLQFLGLVAGLLGGSALLVSWAFDVLLARRGGRAGFALSELPKWHAWLLVLAVIVPLVAFVAATWHSAYWINHSDGGLYGPPKYFWALVPGCMLMMHSACLYVRLRRS
jgi:hypothetical protein